MANVGYATLTVSPSLRGAQATMQRQLGGIMPAAGQRAGRQLGSGIQTGTQSGVGRMAGTMGAISAAAASTSSRLRSSFSGAFTSASRSAADLGGQIRGLAGMGAALAAGLGFVNIASDIYEVATGAQHTEAVLEGLYETAGHGANEAQKMMGLLNDRFGRSGIQMQAFQQGASDLAYLGLTASETADILQFMESTISATGGSAEELGRVTTALASAQNAGRASAAELNQISQAGVPIYDMLADHLGITNAQIRDLTGSGELLVEDVLEAMQAQGGTWAAGLVDGAERANRTWSSAWDSMRNTFVNGIANEVIPLLDRVSPAVHRMAAGIGRGFDALPDALSRVKGAMDEYGITDALRSVYDAAQDLARGAAPFLAGFGTGVGVAFGAAILVIGEISELLGKLGRWMQNNETVVRNFGIAVGVVTGAFLLLKGALAIGGAIAALATPIGWITIAVGLLAAGITWAWRESERFRTVVVRAWDLAKRAVEVGGEVIAGVLDHIRDETTLLGGIWSAVWEGAKNHFDIVWAGIQEAWEAGKRIFQGAWEVIAGILEGDWGRAWEGAKEVALGAWDLLKVGVSTIFDQIWNTIKTFMVDLPQNVGDWLRENIPVILETLGEWWDAFKDWIVETTPKIIDQIKEWGTAIGEWLATDAPEKIIDGATTLWEDHLKPWFEDLPNKITNAFDNVQKFQEWMAQYGPTLLKGLGIAIGVVVLGIPALILLVGAAIVLMLGTIAVTVAAEFTRRMRDAATRAFAAMRQKASERVSAFVDWLRTLPTRAGNVLMSFFPTRMRTVGRAIITGIINGVSGAAGRLYTRLRNIASNALNAAKNALGIASPSRVFRDEVGGEIIAGLLSGLEAGQGQVDRAMSELVSARPVVGQVRVPVSAEVADHAAQQQSRLVGAQRDLASAEERNSDLLRRLLEAVERQGDGDVVLHVGAAELARANRQGERQLARR